MSRPTEAHVGGLGSVRCGDADKGTPQREPPASAAAPLPEIEVCAMGAFGLLKLSIAHAHGTLLSMSRSTSTEALLPKSLPAIVPTAP